MAFSLKVYTSLIWNNPGVYVEDVTHTAIAWQRSTRLQGGCWQGTFTLSGDLNYLLDWFYNRLGYHVEERSFGTPTWDGQIYEMTLNSKGVSRTRSLDDMENAVTIRVRDAETDVVVNTSVFILAPAIARYGRKETILPIDAFDVATANMFGSNYVTAYGYPRPYAQAGGSAFDLGEQPTLDVVVRGYGFTANWQHVGDSADLTTTNINTWIQEIVEDDCPFLSIGRIHTNARQVLRKLDNDTRSWNQIQYLTRLGDDSGNFYRAFVQPGRLFYYMTLNTSFPSYFVRNGELYTNLNVRLQARNQWAAQPGVYRDLDYPVRRTEYGSLFSDGRDFLVDQVTVGTRSGISWNAIEYTEADQIAAQYEYQQWLEDALLPDESSIDGEPVRESRKRTKNRTQKLIYGIPWDRWVKMSPAQRRAARAKAASQ